MNNSEEIELNFDVNVFECYKAFKYKHTKSELSRLKIFIAIGLPLIISLAILLVKFLYNHFTKSIIFDFDFHKTVIILGLIFSIWALIFCILYKKRIHNLATLENEKHMQGKISYKSKVFLEADYMSVNSEVFYGRVYYKGIQDIIVFKDIIVILVKPFKILIIPISAFENLESRKNFISILSEKIKK